MRLVAATEKDLPLIMAWRSNKLLYDGFYSQNSPLTWEEHINWWRTRNRDWRVFLILYDERPVGIVNIGQLDHWSPEVGYAIGETTLWGKGIGKEAVRIACEWVKSYGKEHIHTTILDSNEKSIRLIKSLGFEYLGKARKGESWYQKLL